MARLFSIEAKVQKALAEVERERRRRPRLAAFLLKGIPLAVVLAGGVVLLAGRFSLAIATQAALCLPPYRVWLIDKGDTKPVRGEIFAFKAKGLAPVFSDGTNIVKVLQGMPGDQVSVSTAVTTINGSVVGEGLAVATQYHIDPQRYVRQGRIEPEHFWFLGRTLDSFDSRYWGSVERSQIFGRAYPIW